MRCNSRAFNGDNLDNTPLPTGGIFIPNSVRKWMLSGTYQHFSDLLHLPFSDLTKSIFAGSYLKSTQMTAERSEEHTSELQSREKLVCRLMLANRNIYSYISTP